MPKLFLSSSPPCSCWLAHLLLLPLSIQWCTYPTSHLNTTLKTSLFLLFCFVIVSVMHQVLLVLLLLWKPESHSSPSLPLLKTSGPSSGGCHNLFLCFWYFLLCFFSLFVYFKIFMYFILQLMFREKCMSMQVWRIIIKWTIMQQPRQRNRAVPVPPVPPLLFSQKKHFSLHL